MYQFLTVQVLFVAAALTYARALRWRFDPAQFVKARLILRGNILALASIAATSILDVIATVQRHYEPYRSHAREPLIVGGYCCALCLHGWMRRSARAYVSKYNLAAAPVQFDRRRRAG